MLMIPPMHCACHATPVLSSTRLHEARPLLNVTTPREEEQEVAGSPLQQTSAVLQVWASLVARERAGHATTRRTLQDSRPFTTGAQAW